MVAKHHAVLLSLIATAISSYALWQTHRSTDFQRQVDRQDRLAKLIERNSELDVPVALNVESQRKLGPLVADVRAYIGLYPDAAVAHLMLGQLLVEAREVDEAMAAYDRAVKIDGALLEEVMASKLDYLFPMAELSEEMRPQVAAIIRTFHEQNPDSLAGKFWMATVHQWDDEFEQAEKLLDEVLVRMPAIRCGVVVGIANFKDGMGKTEAAKRIFLTYEFACRDSSVYAMNRGHIHMKLEEYEQAFYLYKRSSELEPDYIGSRHSMIRALQAQKRLNEAKEILQDAKSLPFGEFDPSTFYLEGVVRHDDSDCEGAIESYSWSIRLMDQGYRTESPPPRAALLLGLAQCHAILGNHEDAYGFLEEAAQQSPPGQAWFDAPAAQLRQALDRIRARQAQ